MKRTIYIPYSIKGELIDDSLELSGAPDRFARKEVYHDIKEVLVNGVAIQLKAEQEAVVFYIRSDVLGVPPEKIDLSEFGFNIGWH